MKRIFYYTTTAIIISCGITQAQTCVPTPTCSTLGYTSTTACDGGLKCPFGEAWYCPSNSGGECADFPYTCFGTGYVEGAGIGTDCNGKYVKCECAEGFEWKDEQGCVDITDCRLGSIVYSDKSCSLSGYEIQEGTKTPIGVVVYIDNSDKKWAMTLKSIGEYMWGYGLNISMLPTSSFDSIASKDYASCENTEKIMTAGNKSEYPAAWAAHEYKTAGTEAGDWCLPAAGLFSNIYNNMSAVNTGLEKAGGTKFTTSTEVWSSTNYASYDAWGTKFTSSFGIFYYDKAQSLEVRPVLEF